MNRIIKNYTTEVPTDRTVSEIQQLLSRNGARGIAMEYDNNGKIKDIFFKITIDNKDLPFRLPAKVDKVYPALHGDAPRHFHERYAQQWQRDAERIAWRICKTWLEA